MAPSVETSFDVSYYSTTATATDIIADKGVDESQFVKAARRVDDHGCFNVHYYCCCCFIC